MEIKVPFYNIVNIFLPGLVLLGSSILLFFDEVKTLMLSITNFGSTGLEILVTVSLFAIAYEIGYIIFRLGSLAVEPLLKKMIEWTEYRDFIAAEKTSKKAHDKLEMLSREYGYLRTQITLFIVLAVLTGVRTQWCFMVVCILCIVVFTLSTCGHMKKIQKIVKQYL